MKDTNAVVTTVIREVYRVNGLGQVVVFHDPKDNSVITPPTGAIIGACVWRAEADSLGQYLDVIPSLSGI